MRVSEYAPPWWWIIGAEIKIGEDQGYHERATASHHLREFFKENNAPASQAEVGIMSYQFTKREWNNKKNGYEEGWLDWMRNLQRNKQVKFKLIGGPKIRAKNELSELLSEGVIEEIAIPPKHEAFHVIYCTNPRLLWIEQYHKNRYARKVCYIRDPFEGAWEEFYGKFNKLWDISTKFKEIK